MFFGCDELNESRSFFLEHRYVVEVNLKFKKVFIFLVWIKLSFYLKLFNTVPKYLLLICACSLYFTLVRLRERAGYSFSSANTTQSRGHRQNCNRIFMCPQYAMPLNENLRAVLNLLYPGYEKQQWIHPFMYWSPHPPTIVTQSRKLKGQSGGKPYIVAWRTRWKFCRAWAFENVYISPFLNGKYW